METSDVDTGWHLGMKATSNLFKVNLTSSLIKELRWPLIWAFDQFTILNFPTKRNNPSLDKQPVIELNGDV